MCESELMEKTEESVSRELQKKDKEVGLSGTQHNELISKINIQRVVKLL